MRQGPEDKTAGTAVHAFIAGLIKDGPVLTYGSENADHHAGPQAPGMP
jgi:hypothetical protein